jgi:glycosyltransferase involved in cell wall biosynthesis
VIHLHGADLGQTVGRKKFRLVFGFVWKSVTDIILPSKGMADQLLGLPKRNVHVVPNFSEKIASHAVVDQKATSVSGGELNILYLSNILYSKGFSFLMDGVGDLRRKGVKARLILAGSPMGDAEMTSHMAERILVSKLGDGIQYAGRLVGDEKWDALKKAHVIALPTFYPIEAQPVSLIEGMAFGAIPLTTRHNYNCEFLPREFTVFVKKKSSEDISNALFDIYSNRKEAAIRMKEAALYARKNHSIESYLNGIDEVISKVSPVASNPEH